MKRMSLLVGAVVGIGGAVALGTIGVGSGFVEADTARPFVYGLGAVGAICFAGHALLEKFKPLSA